MPPRDSCMPVCILPATCLAWRAEPAWLATGESAPLARRRADNLTSRNNAALPDASALLAPVKAWQAQDLPRQVTFADGLRQVGFGELPRLSLRWHPRRPSGGAGRRRRQPD